ncbi:histidine phosphatase family protein [Candidatus Woesebacteria bacterium]|nr:histidine phosphatase family protein [Candidatus Woesebacteria bacterium]
MPKKIILVRHGETDRNVEKKLMNWINDIGTLTVKGRSEASQVGQRLKEIEIHAIYASDLKRTQETAQIISEHLSLSPVHVHGLRERNLGIFGDHTFDEIKQKWPEKLAKFLDNADIDWNELEGESIRDVHNRFQGFIAEIESKHKDENVLFVTHSGIIYTVLRDLFDFFPQDSWMDVEHTSITILEKSGDKYILKSFNKTD